MQRSSWARRASMSSVEPGVVVVAEVAVAVSPGRVTAVHHGVEQVAGVGRGSEDGAEVELHAVSEEARIELCPRPLDETHPDAGLRQLAPDLRGLAAGAELEVEIEAAGEACLRQQAPGGGEVARRRHDVGGVAEDAAAHHLADRVTLAA